MSQDDQNKILVKENADLRIQIALAKREINQLRDKLGKIGQYAHLLNEAKDEHPKT